MRKNFKPQPYLYPQPVLVVATYNEDGTPDAMCAAWGTICDNDAVALVLNADHKTVKNIKRNKAFTVSTGTVDQLVAIDYVGMVSGNEVPDKVEKVGWHTEKSAAVNAPIIDELPMTLECKLIKYDEKFECVYGKIVNISIDERVLAEGGGVDVKKLDPVSLDPINGKFIRLGEPVGNAFSMGKEIK
ncbi:MAG: flavin reductase family protein [Clostridia bacterium]|nr:flavin reductase family protein [Clostridia bacterium]